MSRFVGSNHRAGVSHLVDCWGGADLVMAAVKDADQHQSQVEYRNVPQLTAIGGLGGMGGGESKVGYTENV